MHLTYFDFGVFAILGISALLSFFRGFIREVLSLGAWFGAVIITLYAFPHVANLLEHHMNNKTIASGFAALLTFAVSLIAISIISNIMLKFVKEGSDVGLLDHGMGFLFGLARGALVIAIGFFIYTQLFAGKDTSPDWVKHALTRPYVARAAHVIGRIAPGYLDEISGPNKKPADKPDVPPDVKTPDKDVEEDVKTAPEVKAPADDKPATDWPTADDLKQRIQDSTKGN